MPERHNGVVRTIELERLAEELGLDVVGAAPAGPYEETERHIGERRARGLFADMKFTMAQPEVSCHPEKLLPGARTVVSAALCYYAPAPEARAGAGGCWLLRQEHAAHYPPARLVGRARDAGDAGRNRADPATRPRLRVVHPLHRGVPHRSAGRTRHARLDPVPVVLDAINPVDPRGISGRDRRHGLRLRHLP